MDFRPTEEQHAIQELAREILEREVTSERIKEAEEGGDWFDAELWKTLAEANLLGVAIPEQHGGMGFGFEELCLVLEETGRSVAPLPAQATLVLGALPLAAFGTDAQRTAWLPRVASGDAILTASLLDAESADPAAPGTRARPTVTAGCSTARADGFRLRAVPMPCSCRRRSTTEPASSSWTRAPTA